MEQHARLTFPMNYDIAECIGDDDSLTHSLLEYIYDSVARHGTTYMLDLLFPMNYDIAECIGDDDSLTHSLTP
jgi:hypothetical protein